MIFINIGSNLCSYKGDRLYNLKKSIDLIKKQKIKGNIWEYVVGKKAEDQEAKGHPAPFPEEIPNRLIQVYTVKGDTVLDPYGG